MPDLSLQLPGRNVQTVVLLDYAGILASTNGNAFFLGSGLRFLAFVSIVTAGAGILGDTLIPKVQMGLFDGDTFRDLAAFGAYDAGALPPFPDRRAYQGDDTEHLAGVVSNLNLVSTLTGTARFPGFVTPGVPQIRARALVASGGPWSGRLLAFWVADGVPYRRARAAWRGEKNG